MDSAGIDRRVVLIVDWGLVLGEASCDIQTIHREILGICRQHSDRFIGFAGVDPRRLDAPDLVAWAMHDLGARGLKLHPTSSWTLNDARTHAVVQMAADRNRPVLIHVGATIPELQEQNAMPEAFLKLARCFPQTSFIAGHSGSTSYEQFLNADVPKNTWFDLSGWQSLLKQDREGFVSAVTKLQAAFPSRVLFGSDSPFYTWNISLLEKRWIRELRVTLQGATSDFWANTEMLRQLGV